MTTVQGPKVIRKYANRKLYDTEESKYTTLKELAVIFASGRKVQVIDNSTQQDITGKTMLYALVETEADLGSLELYRLHDIFMSGGLAKYLSAQKPVV